MTAYDNFKPYKPSQQTDKPPVGCQQCCRPFDATLWPRSPWTQSGFSPWCPACHVRFAPGRKYRVLIKRRSRKRQEETA